MSTQSDNPASHSHTDGAHLPTSSTQDGTQRGIQGAINHAYTPQSKIQNPKSKISSISVVFPAYNDAGTIASMVLAALNTCAALTDDYEVIVVENGSTDYTVQVLEDLARAHPQLRVSTHREALGYGGALRLGFKLASKEFIFYTDGDAQYDAHELSLLATALRPEVDIVQGYKIARHDPIFRIVIGRIYHWIVKIAFGLPIRDTDCDFRLIRRSALARFTLKSTTGTFPVELVKKLHESGAVFAEVPVHHYHRAYGRSQFFNFKRLWATGLQLLQLWRHLVLRPGMTGRKPVKSVKPPMLVDESNPSLIYSTDVQDRALRGGRRTKDEKLQGVSGMHSLSPLAPSSSDPASHESAPSSFVLRPSSGAAPPSIEGEP